MHAAGNISGISGSSIQSLDFGQSQKTSEGCTLNSGQQIVFLDPLFPDVGVQQLSSW